MATQPLGEKPVFHAGVFIKDSYSGSWTEIGPHCSLVESMLDDYSYIVGDNQIIYSKIGKFSNIASHVRINPGNYPMERVTIVNALSGAGMTLSFGLADELLA